MTTNASWLPPRWLVWIFAGLLLAGVGYSVWWRYAASLLQNTLYGVRDGGAGEGVKAAWDSMDMSGFPLRLRATLDNPVYENRIAQIAWKADGLSVEMLPWSTSQFVLSVTGKQDAVFGSSLQIANDAKETALSILLRPDGLPKQVDIASTTASLSIKEPSGSVFGVQGELLAFHWRIDPDDADAKDGRNYDAAINGKALTVSGAELPFGKDVQDLKLQVTLRDVPALQNIDGAMDLVSWRQSGAPLTIRKLSFVSGGVDVQGSGELSIDRTGMLTGQIDLNVGGLDKIVALLSKSGAIPKEAQSTLFVTSTMLSATGAKVPIPLVFKDGKTFLGPAQIGPAPRFVF